MNDKQMVEYIEKANLGDGDSAHAIALHFEALGQSDEAEIWITKASDLGHRVAALDLFAYYSIDGRCDQAARHLEKIKKNNFIDMKEYETKKSSLAQL